MEQGRKSEYLYRLVNHGAFGVLMTYNPLPLFISFVIITAFFSNCFFRYLSVRKETYALWLQYVVYGQDETKENNIRSVCAKTEALERELHLMTDSTFAFGLIATINLYGYLVYYRSLDMVNVLTVDDFLLATWVKWIMAVIYGTLLLLMSIVFFKTKREFPFFDFNKNFPYLVVRETGYERLKMIWDKFECRKLKKSPYDEKRTPKSFYKDVS